MFMQFNMNKIYIYVRKLKQLNGEVLIYFLEILYLKYRNNIEVSEIDVFIVLIGIRVV